MSDDHPEFKSWDDLMRHPHPAHEPKPKPPAIEQERGIKFDKESRKDCWQCRIPMDDDEGGFHIRLGQGKRWNQLVFVDIFVCAQCFAYIQASGFGDRD